MPTTRRAVVDWPRPEHADGGRLLREPLRQTRCHANLDVEPTQRRLDGRQLGLHFDHDHRPGGLVPGEEVDGASGTTGVERGFGQDLPAHGHQDGNRLLDQCGVLLIKEPIDAVPPRHWRSIQTRASTAPATRRSVRGRTSSRWPRSMSETSCCRTRARRARSSCRHPRRRRSARMISPTRRSSTATMVAIEAHSGIIPHFTRAYFGPGEPPFLPPIEPTVGDEQGMLSHLALVAVGEEDAVGTAISPRRGTMRDTRVTDDAARMRRPPRRSDSWPR